MLQFSKPNLVCVQFKFDDTNFLLNNAIYVQSVSVASEVRKPVYSCVAWRAVDVRQAYALMLKVNWEVKDVMSQHSHYVDVILRVSPQHLLFISKDYVRIAQVYLNCQEKQQIYKKYEKSHSHYYHYFLEVTMERYKVLKICLNRLSKMCNNVLHEKFLLLTILKF